MKVFILLLLLCLMHLTQQCCNSCPLTKVYKKNKTNYSLSNSNTWKEYPDLKVSFELAESRLVNIGYVISIGSAGESHLVTRLIIDDKEVEYYRGITGNSVYHTNTISGYVALSEGKH